MGQVVTTYVHQIANISSDKQYDILTYLGNINNQIRNIPVFQLYLEKLQQCTHNLNIYV